jgi:N-formylglutamate deformylase
MTVPPIFHLKQGSGKLIVSIPHAGTYLPPDIAGRLTDIGRQVVDTDWHVDRLYAFLSETDATVITATHSRTVVDLNRGPDGVLLYPGQAETGLCPTESFDGEPLYASEKPDAAEIGARIERYWRPYHTALQAELDRVRALHGAARLFDAHSIRASVPRLFPGTLPALNLGTNNGLSAEAALTAKVVAAAGDHFSHVVNGRFKGGWITRHYGDPSNGVQAIQLELAQTAYMDEAMPGVFDASYAAPLMATLRNILHVFAGA